MAAPRLGTSLTGNLLWDYAHFEADDDSTANEESEHFLQQYTVMAMHRQNLKGGRLGKFELGLGYQWTDLASEINSRNFDRDASKVLYRGDITVAPGGLPFVLNLYSSDQLTATPRERQVSTLIPRDVQLNSRYFKEIDPIYNDLDDGTTIYSGGSLVIGQSNGSYLGAYRDLFASAPLLMVDYRDVYVEDLESRVNPEKFRDRHLAFVSLNKKDNWLHYRIHEFEDYVDPTQNFYNKSVILGTIDHVNIRRWINLTNWVKISADGTFENYTQPGTLSQGEVMEHDLNLFVQTHQRTWESSFWGNYNRVRDTLQLEKSIELPFFANGEPNKDNAWRFSLTGEGVESSVFTHTGETIYGEGQYEYLRSRAVQFKTSLEAETTENLTGSQGFGARLTQELYSNRKYRRNTDFAFKFDVANFVTEENGALSEDDYSEYALTVNAEHRPSATLAFGGWLQFMVGDGTYAPSITSYMQPYTYRRQSGDFTIGGRTDTFSDATVYSGILRVYVEHTARTGLRNRVEATYDHLDVSLADYDNNFLMTHTLDYTSRKASVSMANRMIFGEHPAFSPGRLVSIAGAATSSGPEADFSLFSRANFKWWHNRNLESGLRYDYFWADALETVSQLALRQELKYTHFAANALRTPLFRLAEELAFEQVGPFSGDTSTGYSLALVGNYYPRRVLELFSRLQYFFRDPEEADTYLLHLGAKLHYSKLHLSLDYSYGDRSESSLVSARNEQRWGVSVQRTF